MADTEYVTKAQYDEHNRTADAERQLLIAENNRQNERISKLESETTINRDLALTVNTLATNMQHMLDELKMHGVRLEKLEIRDGDTWRDLRKTLAACIVTLALGYIFGKIMG